MEESFKKATAIVESWPEWKRDYKLTKYCSKPIPNLSHENPEKPETVDKSGS